VVVQTPFTQVVTVEPPLELEEELTDTELEPLVLVLDTLPETPPPPKMIVVEPLEVALGGN
jgi:hypothetical protein